jgi:hypothetical protein
MVLAVPSDDDHLSPQLIPMKLFTLHIDFCYLTKLLTLHETLFRLGSSVPLPSISAC